MAFPSYTYPAYGGYNPVAPFAPAPQAYQQMPQQVAQPPVQAQMPQQTQQQQPNIICRPVASEEEARAVPTDFSGATLVLTDTGHGKIYTKSLNYMDGSAIFNVYQQVLPQPAPTIPETPAVEYAPKSEVEALRSEIEALRGELEEAKKSAGKKPTAKGATE